MANQYVVVDESARTSTSAGRVVSRHQRYSDAFEAMFDLQGAAIEATGDQRDLVIHTVRAEHARDDVRTRDVVLVPAE